jgi:tetratricopeptide (TPR) repeat protein
MTMAVSDKLLPAQRLRSSLRRSGGSSESEISIECNFVRLEHYLRHVIIDFCQDDQLIEAIQAQTRGLSHRVKAHGVPDCQGELLNAVAILEEFLHLCKDLDAPHTFEVLTFIGQIKLAQEDTTGATLAFTKALWIASCSKERIPPEHRAAALHRMGLAYAQGRQYQQARDVLRKALETYKVAGFASQPQSSEAKALCETMIRKWRESEESWSSLRSSTGQQLAQILE